MPITIHRRILLGNRPITSWMVCKTDEILYTHPFLTPLYRFVLKVFFPNSASQIILHATVIHRIIKEDRARISKTPSIAIRYRRKVSIPSNPMAYFEHLSLVDTDNILGDLIIPDGVFHWHFCIQFEED